MAGDEDSDEDMGKPAGPESEGLDYDDSDENKNDDEIVAVSGST